MYSEADVATMAANLQTIGPKFEALFTALQARVYRTPRAEEVAFHGLGRRLATLKDCIEIMFDAIPPTLNLIPTDNERRIATIALQAFLINVFGCADNLARLWVEERDVRLPGGRKLPDAKIGMGPTYHVIRASFPQTFRNYLDTRSDWFSEMERFRHALAHRIAPYIPPHAVDPKNEAAYHAFEPQIAAAIKKHDFEGAEKLESEKQALMFFRPVFTHSFGENAPFIAIHPQMLVDFNTVDEMARQMLAAFHP